MAERLTPQRKPKPGLTLDETEVRAITDRFTADSDAEHFCGLGVGATLEEVERRFGRVSTMPDLTIMGGREVAVTRAERSSLVQLGPTTYECFVEVFLPIAPATTFPYVDVRLVRQGYVMTELKAAAAALTLFFTELHGRSLRFQRGGVPGEVWIMTSGVRKADAVVKLAPSAVLRVRSSPRR
jgi:hypothetical protein